ncbi:MAG: DUF374 domain-containing protein [Nitrospirota bacterium]
MFRERIISRIAWAILLLWSKTIKFQFVNGKVPEPACTEEDNAIYAFWHGTMVLMCQAAQGSGILIPVSESRDGEIMARLLKNFGFAIVRGSSNRKGHKALRALISSMRKGKKVAIAVDGPRGPRHKVKIGTMFLAGVSKAPIIPVEMAAKRSWVLQRTWDKLIFPVPFTTVVVVFGEPVCVNSTSDADLAAGLEKLESELHRLTRVARDYTASQNELLSMRSSS